MKFYHGFINLQYAVRPRYTVIDQEVHMIEFVVRDTNATGTTLLENLQKFYRR